MRLVGYVHGRPCVERVAFGGLDGNVASYSETCAGGSGAGFAVVDTTPSTAEAVHAVANTVSGRVVRCLLAHKEKRRCFVLLLFY